MNGIRTRIARCALLSVLAALAAAPVRADITGKTTVEFYSNSTLRRATSYPDLYLPTMMHDQITTRVEASKWEALIDAAQLGINLASALDGNIVGAIGAYDEFQQVLDSWGGRGGSGQSRMRVSHPHPFYNRMKIIFDATSDDDDILRPATAPGNVPAAGISYGVTIAETHHWRYVYTINLATLHNYMVAHGVAWQSFPFAFAFREDAAITTLSCAHALTIDMRRVEEPPPTITTSADYYSTVAITGTPVHHAGLMSFAPWRSASQPGFGEFAQSRSLLIARDAFKRCTINGRVYKSLNIVFRLTSNRILAGTSAPYRLQANWYGWSPWVASGQGSVTPGSATDSWGRTYRTEGTGKAWAEIDVTQIKAGDYTLVFIATDLSGRAICQQTVRVKVTDAPPIVVGGGSY